MYETTRHAAYTFPFLRTLHTWRSFSNFSLMSHFSLMNLHWLSLFLLHLQFYLSLTWDKELRQCLRLTFGGCWLLVTLLPRSSLSGLRDTSLLSKICTFMKHNILGFQCLDSDIQISRWPLKPVVMKLYSLHLKKNSCYFLVFLFQGKKLCKHTLPSFKLILQGLWKTESGCTFVPTLWKFFTNTAVLTTSDSQQEEMNSVLQTPLTRVAPTKAMPHNSLHRFPHLCF